MKAVYKLADGSIDEMDCGVIIPEESEHNGGFTLYGFDDWEDKEAGKLREAITGLLGFKIIDRKVGFHK